jgi:hypothetical protein
MSGLLRGQGRRRGVPNRSTRAVKRFLASVFDDVFAREEFRQRLVASIVDLSIDPRLLTVLLGYYAGRPAVAMTHMHREVSLAAIIAGRVSEELAEREREDEDDDDGGEPPWRQ